MKPDNGKQARRRVVVSGMGAVSPNGIGAAGLAAAILAMKDGFLPPTINYQEPDPECDLNYIPNRGAAREVEVALCNCIGFGSKNSALVVGRGDLAGKERLRSRPPGQGPLSALVRERMRWFAL